MSDLVSVKIYGLNLSRLLERLIDRGVGVYNAQIKGRVIYFSIERRNLDELNKVCKLEHKFFQVIGDTPLKNFFKKLPYFLGAVLALVIVLAHIYSLTLFVYEVDVSCSSGIECDIEGAKMLLQQNGIVAGMRRSEVDKQGISNLILKNLDDVAGCTVRREGGKLFISLFPAKLKYEVFDGNIISAFDGVVTFAEAFCGDLQVKVGDMVKKGDVLIKNNGGASGKIEGKVYFSSGTIYNQNQQELVPTGRTMKVRNIRFFKFFTLKSKKICDFSAFSTTKCDFYLTKNYLFPFVVEEITYSELVPQNKLVPFSEVESKILNQAYELTLELVKNKDKITNVTYSVVSEGNYTRVDCFIEVEMSLF